MNLSGHPDMEENIQNNTIQNESQQMGPIFFFCQVYSKHLGLWAE